MPGVRVQTCTMTELRRGLSSCIARVTESGEPLVITRRGKGVAVLISLEQYERMRRDRDELLARARRHTHRADAAALLGAREDSGLDEADHRSHLENKHR